MTATGNRLNIREIARRAGVSIGTVSRVLKHEKSVSPELYNQTMKIIRETGYEIPAGRRRFTEKTRIAVVFAGYGKGWDGSAVITEYLQSVEKSVGSRDFERRILLRDDFLKRGTDPAAWREFDGLVIKLGGYDNSSYAKGLNSLAEHIPMVGLDTCFTELNFPQVSFDNAGAGTMVTNELYRRGHRRIAFLNHDMDHAMFIARSTGYMEAMRSRQLWDNRLLVECKANVRDPLPEPPELSKELDELLKLPEPPTAVIVANDWGAAGLYRAAMQRKLEIPQQLSIFGFDNLTSCFCMLPPLSSVERPLQKISDLAFQLLFSKLDGQSELVPNRLTLVPGTVFVRGSVRTISSS